MDQASLFITNSQSLLNSCPSNQWCHQTISFSVGPFCCFQSIPASESFPMSQLFTWGGQSTGVSASASFLPKKSQGYLLQNGLVGSPCSPRDSQVFSNSTVQKHHFFGTQPSSSPQIRILLESSLLHAVWDEVFSTPVPMVYLLIPHTEGHWATGCNYSYMLC